ncbi:symporter small accessory protein [Geoglobus acetivorans]
MLGFGDAWTAAGYVLTLLSVIGGILYGLLRR